DKSTLNQLFLQSFAVRAVFLPFLRGCHALPNHLFMRGSAVPVPPREGASAESTFQLTAESKFSTVLVPLAFRAEAAILASSMQYVLCLFKFFLADNRLMMIFDIKLIFLAVIVQSSLGNGIDGKCLSLQQVAFVLLILYVTKNGCVLPFDSSVLGFMSSLSQFLCNNVSADPRCISFKNIADDFGFFLINGD